MNILNIVSKSIGEIKKIELDICEGVKLENAFLSARVVSMVFQCSVSFNFNGRDFNIISGETDKKVIKLLKKYK